MSVRTSMSDLIAAVRLLINDPSSAPLVIPLFTDQAIQDALDHVRVDINYLELATKPQILAGGTVVWLDYYALSGTQKIADWESDVVLQGYPSFATLSPITSDYLTGHWTFDTSLDSTGQRPPVYLRGKTYDRYSAAVELLEDWAAQLTLQFTFSSDNQRFQLKDKSDNLLRLADRYKRKARPVTLQMVRGDTPPAFFQRGANDLTGSRF